MPKNKRKKDLVMNKIIQHGLTDENGLKPEIQGIFDALGLEVMKVIRKNGEAFTKGGDSVLFAGSPDRMNALLKLFPKGFVFAHHCKKEE